MGFEYIEPANYFPEELLKKYKLGKYDDYGLSDRYAATSDKLFKYIYKNSEDKNVVCSPFSLWMLLGIAINAVGGNSWYELYRAISSASSFEDINKEFRKFQAQMVGKEKLVSSNGICVKESIYPGLKKEFVKRVKKTFGAEIFPAGDDMVQKVNAWVNEKTDGMIPELLSSAPKDLQAVLMNAVSFMAAWMNKYDEDDIFDAEFTNIDSTKSEVKMMYSSEEEYIEDEYFKGFVKDYEGEKYAFMALLPRNESPEFLDEAVARADLRSYFESRKYAPVDAEIPEFEIDAQMELAPFCRELGIDLIFTEKADFSEMTDEKLMVDSVLQKAFIKVDRAGTKAAAATAMVLRVGCAPRFEERKEVILDRPFVYAIVEKESGLPIFSGVVRKM